MIKSPIFMHPKKTGMIFNSRKISIIISLNFLIINVFFAQDKKKWDVNNPELPYKIVEFITSEGTWMNVDVSPDGKLIAFDLLGDIYTIPFAGGKAKPIRTGLAYEVQPRFSPDGKSILFTSDAGGGDNIWVMNIDGKNARQVTKENFRLLNNAVWMPDGEYFVARKHFTSTRSLGAGELWMYHIAGGTGVQITAKKNDQQDLNVQYLLMAILYTLVKKYIQEAIFSIIKTPTTLFLRSKGITEKQAKLNTSQGA